MKLEDQVSSLELSMRLKDLGVRQESYFVWAKDGTIFSEGGIGFRMNHHDGTDECAAFTVAELGEMLPTDKVQTLKWFDIYYCEAWEDVVNKKGSIGKFIDETEANARAKMLIRLIEKGIVKP